MLSSGERLAVTKYSCLHIIMIRCTPLSAVMPCYARGKINVTQFKEK